MAGVGLFLNPSLVARLEEFAEDEGVEAQEAFEIAVGLGLELALGRSGKKEERLARVESGLDDLRAAVDLLGPPLFSVLRVLVAWAAREGFGLSEDELHAEILTASRAEWALALAERGIVEAGDCAET
jgi:hypothetical protein